MFLILDTCLWFSEKHFQKMISREGLNHFRHQLTYLPLKQEPLPCSCYLDPSQGCQLYHLFSFIYCIYPWLITVCTWWGPNPFHGDWPQVWFRQDSARDVSHTLLSCLLSHWSCFIGSSASSTIPVFVHLKGWRPLYTNPFKVDDTLYLVLHASRGEVPWCGHRCALPIPRTYSTQWKYHVAIVLCTFRRIANYIVNVHHVISTFSLSSYCMTHIEYATCL